jgi:acetyltransferase-like isoleucine patch superfamily enzyme
MLAKRIINYVKHRSYYLLNCLQFGYLAPSAIIQKSLRIEGKQNMSIGKGVVIQQMTWLAALPLTRAPKCNLSIGDGCIIGHFNHIYATGEIRIGRKVLTADKVYIADNQHGYEDILKPVLEQSIQQFPPMSIGDGTWLGESVCVLGVSIGRNCVIGANSVVTKEIPDYCLAVGAPARIIKKYNTETNQWEKV